MIISCILIWYILDNIISLLLTILLFTLLFKLFWIIIYYSILIVLLTQITFFVMFSIILFFRLLLLFFSWHFYIFLNSILFFGSTIHHKPSLPLTYKSLRYSRLLISAIWSRVPLTTQLFLLNYFLLFMECLLLKMFGTFKIYL
jgi:hypothetical protein